MLSAILFLLLVLAVAALMVVDLARTRSETPHGHVDRPADAAPRVTAVPASGPVAGTFSPQAAGSVTAVPAPAPGLPRPPEGIASRPGSGPRPGIVPAYHDGSRSRSARQKVRSPIALLVTIPAITAAVVTLCIVRIVTSLAGSSIHSQIGSVHDGAVISVIVASVVLVIVLALGLWATVKAAMRLPDTGDGGRPTVGAVDMDSSDELGEGASAFDQMRRDLSRLTANEAALRGKLNALFVNLGHRSRSLVERQIRIIEGLERGEHDERRLASLARVNRIAFHLHRSSQNLLILAGQEPSNSSNQPVTLTYLVQAVASEIEEGERVSSDVQPDITVDGPAAGELAHILAELIQNATSFSAADMPVRVTGHTLATGGVLVDITDRGIGMTDKELAYANWQLENPPATDIDTSKWMGLLVVGRLAARHRIRIRLNQAESGGLKALVWLPDEVLAHQGVPTPPTHSDLRSARSASGLPVAAVDPGYATADRTIAPAASAGVASPPGNPWAAPAGPRLATDAGQRPSPARASGGPQPVSRADSPVVARGERSVTRQAEGPATPALSGQAVHGNVIVPPAEDPARTSRPRIYDEMESNWFSGGRQVPGSSDRTAAAENRWSSPADIGWKAAQTIDSPSSGGSTAAGLPRRLPNANLVPGSIPDDPPAAPSRSAAEMRDRLAALQRGVIQGRTAASEAPDPTENDQP